MVMHGIIAGGVAKGTQDLYLLLELYMNLKFSQNKKIISKAYFNVFSSSHYI